MEPQMRKSSSHRGAIVPPINTASFNNSGQYDRLAIPLHEQASQTLKFCPSQELMQQQQNQPGPQYRTAASGAPPLPTNHRMVVNQRQLNSERGLRENQRLLATQNSSQIAAGLPRAPGNTNPNSHRHQQEAANMIYVSDSGHHEAQGHNQFANQRLQEQYFEQQSTSIEQNVMMFDLQQQQPSTSMSAFEHIQDELARLNDQLQEPEPVRTKRGASKQGGTRAIRRASRPGSVKQQARQGSRSASRSKQVQQDAMSRLASGQRSTNSQNKKSIMFRTSDQTQAPKDANLNRIRTHARLNSTQSTKRLAETGNQQSQRSLRSTRKKSASSVPGSTNNLLADRHVQHKVRHAYETMQHQHQQQYQANEGSDGHQQPHLKAQRSGSQRSFTNLPQKRLQRARSRSTKTLGSQKSGTRFRRNSTSEQAINYNQTNNSQKGFGNQNLTRVYVPTTQHLNYTTVPDHSNSLLLGGGNASAMLNPVDQTLLPGSTSFLTAGQHQLTQHHHHQVLAQQDNSLVNILTCNSGEPPQYLLAQSCEQTATSMSQNGNLTQIQQQQDEASASVVQQPGNQSASQIEQIMARYEQLCKKLDEQASNQGQVNPLVASSGYTQDESMQLQQYLNTGQVNTQTQQQYQEECQPHMMLMDSQPEVLGGGVDQSLDMYIAKHEESMLQESTCSVEPSQQQDTYAPQNVNGIALETQTLDSPARHIGPREYIEMLSNKQEDGQRVDHAKIQGATGRFEGGITNESQVTGDGETSLEALQFAEAEAIAELQARMVNQESEINLAENHLVNASQFNQLSQVTEKEGTSHFQGIALTTSELNAYQDSSHQMAGIDNKENDDHLINVRAQNTPQQNQPQHPQQPTFTDESQNENLISMQSHHVPNTQQTSKHGAFLRSNVISGQHTHAQASVTSYNTADFTKLSINHTDILSNQKSQKNAAEVDAQQPPAGGNAAVAMAMKKLQDRSQRLEEGLKSAMQIILQLGQQLNHVQGGVDPLSAQLTQRVDELESVESLVDLLAFMRNDKRNLLARNPQIQRVVQNSLHLFQPTEVISLKPVPSSHNTSNGKVMSPTLQNSHHFYENAGHQNNNPSNSNRPISDSDSKMLLQLENQSSSLHQTTSHKDHSNQATSPPVQRCATEMSGLIGSPVGFLDLSAVNQFSQHTASNVKNLANNNNNTNQHQQQQQQQQRQQTMTSEKMADMPPSLDTVKLCGVGQYAQVEPFETQKGGAQNKQATHHHERGNSEHVQAQADGQLLTLRNQKIFEADESNIFSQTMSPNGEQSRRQANMVTHLFSQEEESSISHHKTSGRQPHGQVSVQDGNTGRGTNAELSFDSVFSKEPLNRLHTAQQQPPFTNIVQPPVQQQIQQPDRVPFQGYSPVILNRVSEIHHQPNESATQAYTTATFVDGKNKESARSGADHQTSVSASSARSSVFNAANQSLDQQQLTDIMFASVRNPAMLGLNKQRAANQDAAGNPDDGSNVGILTAMAQKRRQPSMGGGQTDMSGQGGSGVANMPWKSLNLSKLNPPDQNTNQQRFGPNPIVSSKQVGLGLNSGSQSNTMKAENRRQKGYNIDQEEEQDEDLEQASQLLTIDDFAPNFISQKPFSPTEQADQHNDVNIKSVGGVPAPHSAAINTGISETFIHQTQAHQSTETNTVQAYTPTTQQNAQQTLVSFRRMTNRGGASESQQSLESHADRVAAALLMSSGPDQQQPNSDDASATELNTDSQALTELADARSKFLGGFTSLKSEISQLKQTMLDE